MPFDVTDVGTNQKPISD